MIVGQCLPKGGQWAPLVQLSFAPLAQTCSYATDSQARCLHCRHLQLDVALRVVRSKYFPTHFLFSASVFFALALGLFWLPLNNFGLCHLVFDS